MTNLSKLGYEKPQNGEMLVLECFSAVNRQSTVYYSKKCVASILEEERMEIALLPQKSQPNENGKLKPRHSQFRR